MWKDFFYFTKTERKGIIVLVVLILGVAAASAIVSTCAKQKDVDLTENKESEKEYTDFIASLQASRQQKKYPESSGSAYSKREIMLSTFDPNTADSITFLNLGLPPWMAKNILSYRRKQGVFRKPEDFRKVYGLEEEKYQSLLPYIHIADHFSHFSPKDTVGLFIEHGEKRDSVFKYKPGTLIDLNKADTTELKKIPGIGSGIAQKIVNYRKRLGAFYRIEQLQEIHLKADKLRPWFTIDTSQIPRIHLNKVGMERMMYHPYINYYQAKVIIEYRKKKGKLNSLKQLSLYEEFTSEDFERIHPYVCFD